MPRAKAATRGKVARGSKQLASIGQRVLAWIIDLIIIGIIAGILGALGIGSMALGAMMFNPTAMFFGAGMIITLIGVAIFYTLFLEGYWQGQTVGKRAMHIRVVDEKTYKPETMGQAVVRNLLRIIDNQILGLVALVLIAATPRRQRIGDMLAKTVVVQE